MCSSSRSVACGPFTQLIPTTAAPAAWSRARASAMGSPPGRRPSSAQASEQIIGPGRSSCLTAIAISSSSRSRKVSKKIRSTPPSNRAEIWSRKHRARSMHWVCASSAVRPSGPTLPATYTDLPRAAWHASWAAAKLSSLTRSSSPWRTSRGQLEPKLLVSMIRAPASMYCVWMLATRSGALRQNSSRQRSKGTSAFSMRAVPMAPSPQSTDDWSSSIRSMTESGKPRSSRQPGGRKVQGSRDGVRGGVGREGRE